MNTTSRPAILEVMTLCDFARSHDGVNVVSYDLSTITLTSLESVDGLAGRSEPETIPATRAAVRTYLGY